MMGYAPCGACRAYVPIWAGCPHWRVRWQRGKSEASRQAKLARDKEYYRTKMTPAQRERKRARDREYQQTARERARADVAAFKRGE